MGAPVLKPLLNEVDYHAWLVEQAAHLRTHRVNELDYEALAEELEDLGRSERRAIESHLKNLLLHLLKWSRQTKRRSRSWRESIDTSRDALIDLLEDSPSLRPHLPVFLERQYPRARRSAATQTGLVETSFPSTCPFTLVQILDREFFPKLGKE